MTTPRLIPGEIYEITARIQIDFGPGFPATIWPKFLRFIGWSSRGEPVFQDGDKFNEYASHIITQIHSEKPE